MNDALLALFNAAFQQFLVDERENIMDGTAEENLSGRLGFKLDALKRSAGFGEYIVDPEYNRMQEGRIKQILDENMEVIRIKCDLLLHGRGKAVAMKI